jgi:hypothetical protein
MKENEAFEPALNVLKNQIAIKRKMEDYKNGTTAERATR